MKQTKIISGFPGIGKTSLFNNEDFKELKIMDSDSSKFSWAEVGVRHPNFPDNYINHIKSNIGKVDVILVSSHDIVREALVKHGIPFTIVYPSKECKTTYIENYKGRGNNEAFIEFIDKNWNKFLEDIDDIDCGLIHKIALKEGEYLSDIIKDI